jgi:hypothetical protein
MKEIKLKNGSVTLVDDDDYIELSKHKWLEDVGGYASRMATVNGKRVKVYMHRVIMNPPPRKVVDHIDRAKLNNQKSNLRVCSWSQNLVNSEAKKHGKNGGIKTSRFKGVYVYISRKGQYEYKYFKASAKIGDRIIGKVFPFTEEGEILAARAYNEMVKARHGEYAYLNPID